MLKIRSQAYGYIKDYYWDPLLHSVPGVRKIPWRRNGSSFQYSCLEHFMDRGTWWVTIHGVAKSRTRPSDLTFSPFKIKNAASVLILVGWPIAPHFIFSSKGCCSKAEVYYIWLISCLNGNKNGKAGWCVCVAVTCVLAGAENLLGRQIITFSPLNHWSLSL